MELKIRKTNADGIVRLESSGDIKEVMINEDILHPNKESIALGFVGKNSSGLIEFTPKELERLFESVKQRLHLIKGMRQL